MQSPVILSNLRHITHGDWKVLVLDPDSRRLVDNVLDTDEILNENITSKIHHPLFLTKTHASTKPSLPRPQISNPSSTPAPQTRTSMPFTSSPLTLTSWIVCWQTLPADAIAVRISYGHLYCTRPNATASINPPPPSASTSPCSAYSTSIGSRARPS